MPFRPSAAIALVYATSLCAIGPALAAPPPPSNPASAHPAPPAPAAPSSPMRSGSPTADAAPSADQDLGGTGGDQAGMSHNAARTRMRECGHQWSAMKHSGAAGTMTWKEFSAGCLARK